MPEIAITGLGAVAPNGTGTEAFWEALKRGLSGIGPVTRFDASGYPSRIAGEVSLPLSSFRDMSISNNNLSLSSKLILTASYMALEDAGILKEEFADLPSGIWVGTSTTDMGMLENEYDSFKASGVAQPYFVSSSYPHAAASNIGTELRCLGPVITVSIGCTSGLLSIIQAAEAIAKGKIDIALTGGGDAPIMPFSYSGFCEGGFLSTGFNNSPSEASRPFDARRDGGVLSEGSGMIVLENAQRADRLKKRVYGYLKGWHTSNAFNQKVMVQAFQFSMTGALKAARLNPFEIDYICANAPGDPYIDATEVRAVERLLSRKGYGVPMSSIKSSIGNPLSAAGPLQVICSLLAMKDNFLPPTINLENPRPATKIDLVPQKGRFARVGNVLINSQGLGGSNISFVLSSPLAAGNRACKRGGELSWR